MQALVSEPLTTFLFGHNALRRFKTTTHHFRSFERGDHNGLHHTSDISATAQPTLTDTDTDTGTDTRTRTRTVPPTTQPTTI